MLLSVPKNYIGAIDKRTLTSRHVETPTDTLCHMECKLGTHLPVPAKHSKINGWYLITCDLDFDMNHYFVRGRYLLLLSIEDSSYSINLRWGNINKKRWEGREAHITQYRNTTHSINRGRKYFAFYWQNAQIK